MAQKIDNLGALDWDDSALIRAYNKGMSLRGKDLEKENNAVNKSYKKSSKKKLDDEWKVGDHCRAVYYGDNLWYEAQITAIDGDMCTVEFLGYDEEVEVDLDSLDKSLGKKAIKKQKKHARKNAISDVDIDGSADFDDTKIDNSVIHGSFHHHRHHSKKGHHHRNNENHTFDQTNNFTANDSTFHNAYPLMRYPEMPTTMPPVAVPPCSDIIQNPALSSMLTAWYMAGYYTGLHQGQKNASHQHCFCSQAHNYHQ